MTTPGKTPLLLTGFPPSSNLKAELNRRIRTGWMVYNKLYAFLKIPAVLMKRKRNLFNQCILPAMTYGCEELADQGRTAGGGSTQDGGEGWPTRLRLHREDQRVAPRRSPSRWTSSKKQGEGRGSTHGISPAGQDGRWTRALIHRPAAGQEREEDDQGLAGQDPPPKRGCGKANWLSHCVNCSLSDCTGYIMSGCYLYHDLI